jgi:glycosyltransferase involved in cell wall biosynthesis
MNSCIISKSNAYGLLRDASILRTYLENSGWGVEIKSKKDRGLLEALLKIQRYDLAIALETPYARWIDAAKYQVFIPNQEIMLQKHLRLLGGYQAIWAKTQYAYNIFKSLNYSVELLGFTSEDIQIAGHKNWGAPLHVAGNSPNRGTKFLIDLWSRRPDYPELTIIYSGALHLESGSKNIRLINKYMSANEMCLLKNQSGIHLCPSQAEGWGHNIVEALACGSVVVTLDAPPMNEHISEDEGFLVPAICVGPHGLGGSWVPKNNSLENALDAVFSTPTNTLIKKGEMSRLRYEKINDDFHLKLSRLLANLARKTAL